MRFAARLTIFTLIALMLVVTVAYAAVGWGTASFGPGTTGWNGTNYVLNNSTVTGLGGNVVCLDWSYTDQSSVAHSGSVLCSNTTGNAYQCLLPGTSVPNANASGIAWTFRAKATNCAGTINSTGPTSAASPGVFAPSGTGSNAVSLSNFAAVRAAISWQMAAIAMLGLLGLGAGLWWARNRRQALAG